jgi:hypothetical protein
LHAQLRGYWEAEDVQDQREANDIFRRHNFPVSVYLPCACARGVRAGLEWCLCMSGAPGAGPPGVTGCPASP